MTFQEAKQKALEVPWKIEECGQEKCWCRMIVPEEPILYDNNEEFYICGSGEIHKELAEKIVEDHNQILLINNLK